MRPLLLLIFLLLPPLALAQGVAPTDGYLARVVVADQADATRTIALGEAMGQVLERVSGQPATHPRLLPLQARAARLLQRYSYERDTATGQLLLVAGFDPRGIDAAVRGTGLPVWGQVAVPTEDVSLSVSGLRGVGDYGRALAAVRALPGVRGLSVVGAEDSRLQLRARVEGGAAALGAAVSPALQRQADAEGLMSYSLTAPAAPAAPATP